MNPCPIIENGCVRKFTRGNLTATLYHANCLNILPGLSGIDVVVSDPPYGNGDSERYGRQEGAANYGRSQLGHRTIIGDDNLNEWLHPAADGMFKCLKEKAYAVAFCQWRTFREFEDAFQDAGFEQKSIGVWDKCNAGLGAGISEQWEGIFFFRKGGVIETRFRGNVFTYPRVAGRPEHPNQKPGKLMEELVNLVSKEGDVVLDPFMGSGSTGLAAIKCGRSFVGCEMDKTHFETACRRIELEMEQAVFAYVQPVLVPAADMFAEELIKP